MTIKKILADPSKNREKSDQEKAVFKALENSEFKWRTIVGITGETKLPADVVLKVIADWSEEVMISSVTSTKGEDLYTTRLHYKEKSTLLDNIASMVRFPT